MIYFFFIIHFFVKSVYATDVATPAATVDPVASITPTITSLSNITPTVTLPLLVATVSPTITEIATPSALPINKNVATVSARTDPTIILTPTLTPPRVPIIKALKTFIAPEINFPKAFLQYTRGGNFYASDQLSPFTTTVLLSLSGIFFLTGLLLIFWDKIHNTISQAEEYE